MPAIPTETLSPNLRLEVLRFSPNPEAQMLVDHIPGVHFDHVPRRVDLDPKNTFTLLRDSGLRSFLGVSAKNLLLPERFKEIRGLYIKDYNIILIFGKDRNQESNQATALHENAHGFIDQVNPHLNDYARQHFLDYLGSKSLNYGQFIDLWRRKSLEFFDNLSPEEQKKLTAYTTISEGLANWCETEAILQARGIRIRRELLNLHKSVMNRTSRDLIHVGTGGALYQRGHFFVIYVIEDLIEAGKTAGQAVELIAKYPPEDTEVMWHHDRFAKALLEMS